MYHPRARVLAAAAALAPVVGGATPAVAAPPLAVVEIRVLGALPGAEGSAAEHVNERGEALGFSAGPDGLRRVFWDAAGRPQVVEPPAGALVATVALGDRGHVAGNLFRPGGTTAFVWRAGQLLELPAPAGWTGFASDVNAPGDVAGTIEAPDGSTRAVVWRDGGRVDLPAPAGRSTSAAAINDRGEVAGTAQTPDGLSEPVLWTRGRVRVLETLEPTFSASVRDLNERGDVLGSRTGTGPNADTVAVIWTRTGPVDLGLFQPEDLNDRREAVGNDVFEFRALRWRRGTLTELGQGARVVALNDAGVAVGYAGDVAVAWDRQGRQLELGDLGGGRSVALAVNDRGEVAGSADRADGTTHAVIWQLGRE